MTWWVSAPSVKTAMMPCVISRAIATSSGNIPQLPRYFLGLAAGAGQRILDAAPCDGEAVGQAQPIERPRGGTPQGHRQQAGARRLAIARLPDLGRPVGAGKGGAARLLPEAACGGDQNAHGGVV